MTDEQAVEQAAIATPRRLILYYALHCAWPTPHCAAPLVARRAFRVSARGQVQGPAYGRCMLTLYVIVILRSHVSYTSSHTWYAQVTVAYSL